MKWIVSVGVLATVALVAVRAGPAVTKACVANASWKENCNDCICSEAGLPMCTKRVCPEPLPTSECTPGTTWRQSCNSCRCTPGGVGVCTQMACLYDGDVPATLPQPMPDHTRPTECREGHTWKEDCNTCRCSGGRKACTMMACLGLGASGAGSGLESPSLLPAPIHESPIVLPAPLTSQDCVPGETWKEDCNSCRCLPSRQAACTMARCISRREVGGAAPSPTPALGGDGERRCTTGDVWKDDCNTCRCGPSGLPACTKMRCIKLDELAGARVTRAAQYQTFPPQGHRGPGQVGCVSGTTWKQDCNTCNCINGREVCTFALCVGQ